MHACRRCYNRQVVYLITHFPCLYSYIARSFAAHIDVMGFVLRFKYFDRSTLLIYLLRTLVNSISIIQLIEEKLLVIESIT